MLAKAKRSIGPVAGRNQVLMTPIERYAIGWKLNPRRRSAIIITAVVGAASYISRDKEQRET